MIIIIVIIIIIILLLVFKIILKLEIVFTSVNSEKRKFYKEVHKLNTNTAAHQSDIPTNVTISNSDIAATMSF